MKRGVVIEITNKEVVVLTPDGQFCKTRKTDQEVMIGEEISFFPQADPTPSKWFSWLTKEKLAVTLASFVMLLALMPLFSVFTSQQVYGYVSIDINPSVELTLNKKMKVIEVSAFNAEGDQLLNSLTDWNGKSFETVTDQIVELSLEQGYLQKNKEILFSSTVADHVLDSGLSELISNKLTEIEEKHHVDASAIENDLFINEEAKKHNMSPGKYGLMVASAAQGYYLNIDEVKKTPVNEITSEIGPINQIVNEKVTKKQAEQWKKNLPKALKKKEDKKQVPGHSNSKKHNPKQDEEKEDQSQNNQNSQGNAENNERDNPKNKGQEMRENNPGKQMRENNPGKQMRENNPGKQMRENNPGKQMRENNPGKQMRENNPGKQMRENNPGKQMRENTPGQEKR